MINFHFHGVEMKIRVQGVHGGQGDEVREAREVTETIFLNGGTEV
jgi:hypothetical protein